jgi:hypothetical protein
MFRRIFTFALLVFVNLVAIRAMSQTQTASATNAVKSPEGIWTKRKVRIKTDILNYIKTLPRSEQIKLYATLGNMFWESDQNEAERWIAKAGQIALDPATEYESGQQQVNTLEEFTFNYDLNKRAPELAKQLQAQTVRLLLEDAKRNGAAGYQGISLYLAQKTLTQNPKLALDLALVSLKDPAVSYGYNTIEFLWALEAADVSLADQYVAAWLQKIRDGDQDHFFLSTLADQFYPVESGRTSRLTMEQKKGWLNLIADLVEQDTELLRTDGSNCQVTAFYGRRYSDELQKLLPERFPIVAQRIAACRQLKPDYFAPAKPRTIDSLLQTAKTTPDELRRFWYVISAEQMASTARNYPLAIEILDSVDENSRQKFGAWRTYRTQTTVKFVQHLLEEGDFQEIDRVLDETPQELRPCIILDSTWPDKLNASSHQRELRALYDRAKVEFQKMDFAALMAKPDFHALNPARIATLVGLYAGLGDEYSKDVLDTFDEYIELQNRLIHDFAVQTPNGGRWFYYDYPHLPRILIDRYFDLVYGKIDEIDAPSIRIGLRFDMLKSVAARAR